MVCKHMMSYNLVFSLFIAYIAIIEAQNPEASVVPVTRVHISSLWQPSFDICQDPIHGGHHHGSNAVNGFDSFHWTEFRTKMKIFRRLLRSQEKSFERRICTETLRLLRNFTIHDFIEVNSTLDVSQNQAVGMYQDVTSMTHIFSILDSDGARKCCLNNSIIYSKLTTQILPEIFYLVSGYIINWPVHSCTQRLAATVHEQLNCEEVRNLILLVYKYGMEQSRDILHVLRNEEN